MITNGTDLTMAEIRFGEDKKSYKPVTYSIVLGHAVRYQDGEEKLRHIPGYVGSNLYENSGNSVSPGPDDAPTKILSVNHRQSR